MLAAVLVIAALAASDTTIVLASTSRDLTGDGRPEILSVTGVGPNVDSLRITLTIRSDGRLIYSARLRFLSRARDVGNSFFEPEKFLTPTQFVERLRGSTPDRIDDIADVIAREGGFPRDTVRAAAIWREIRRSGVTIFEYSPGGDGVTAIGWSARTRRFYRLFECC